MFFSILGAIAEFEYVLMSERTADGLTAARARVCTGGRTPKLDARQVQMTRAMYDELVADGKRAYTVCDDRQKIQWYKADYLSTSPVKVVVSQIFPSFDTSYEASFGLRRVGQVPICSWR